MNIEAPKSVALTLFKVGATASALLALCVLVYALTSGEVEAREGYGMISICLLLVCAVFVLFFRLLRQAYARQMRSNGDTENSGGHLRLIRTLEQLEAWRGLPKSIRLDNGPELTALYFTEWCAEKGIALRYLQPGNPNQNAFIE